MRALELARDGRHGGGRASKRALPERSLHVWLYGVDQNAYEEQGLARMLAARLAPELGANLAECRVVDRFDLLLFKQFGSLPHKARAVRRTSPYPRTACARRYRTIDRAA